MKKIFFVISMLGFYNSFAMEQENSALKIKLSDFQNKAVDLKRINYYRSVGKNVFSWGKFQEEDFEGFSISYNDSEEHTHIFRILSAQYANTFFGTTCQATDNPETVELIQITSEFDEFAACKRKFEAMYEDCLPIKMKRDLAEILINRNKEKSQTDKPEKHSPKLPVQQQTKQSTQEDEKTSLVEERPLQSYEDMQRAVIEMFEKRGHSNITYAQALNFILEDFKEIVALERKKNEKIMNGKSQLP